MFHYKPSSYWGTPIYGNPQIAVWTINKWHYEPSSSSFAHSLSKDPSILETWNWSKTSFSLGWCRTSFHDCSKKGIAKMALGLPPKKKFKAKNTKLKPGAQIHATVPWYTMKRAPGISCSGSACGHDFGMGICHPNFSKSSVGSNQS